MYKFYTMKFSWDKNAQKKCPIKQKVSHKSKNRDSEKARKYVVFEVLKKFMGHFPLLVSIKDIF